MNVIEESRELCEKKAAQTIAEQLTKRAQEKDHVVFGICGGRSVAGIFLQLLTHELPWKKIHIFMIDERCVSLNSLESNYRPIHEAFIKKLIEARKLPTDNAHPFIYNPDNAFGSLRAYDNLHVKYGGVFDVILVSSGEDGHIAALYPKHHTIKNEATRFFLMHDSPKPPAKRMTASRKLILKSHAGILLFFGSEKEKAWQAFNDPAKTYTDCPAKLITQLPEAYVFKSKESL